MRARAAKSVAADEIAAIDALISDLETRLHHLSSNARRETPGASADVKGFVSEALAGIMARVREGASEANHSAIDEATRLGTAAFKKLTDEVEHRPMIMLGIAAAVGFIAGLTNRR